MFTRNLIKLARRSIPKISKTEKIALKAGTIGFDKSIFNGDPKLSELSKYNTIEQDEFNIIDEQIDDICNTADPYDIIINRKVPNEIWNKIRYQ
jgi:acyl-CoA dehydrogenase